MATPESFALNRNIFNESLYSSIRDFWFRGVPEGTTASPQEAKNRWYGLLSQEENEAFDRECRENFRHALDAVGPEKLVLPTFESYERDTENAESISKPFLSEVTNAYSKGGEKQGADTLLALTLLFDQLTRNIYRDPAGLRLVFGHYDRLAYSLLRGSLRVYPTIIAPAEYRHRPVVRSWFLMPLMHSEHLPAHELFMDIVQRCKQELESAGDQAAADDAEHTLGFERMHQEPLRKFGRYPHRNEALGRKSTREEEEYLKSGETFGVQQGSGSESREKSEL